MVKTIFKALVNRYVKTVFKHLLEMLLKHAFRKPFKMFPNVVKMCFKHFPKRFVETRRLQNAFQCAFKMILKPFINILCKTLSWNVLEARFPSGFKTFIKRFNMLCKWFSKRSIKIRFSENTVLNVSWTHFLKYLFQNAFENTFTTTSKRFVEALKILMELFSKCFSKRALQNAF